MIKDFVENYKKGFQDLGYMLDNAKTIVSLFKATYLNENWYDGTQLTVTAKTAMKICPGIEERGSSTSEVCQAFMGAARGAMKKGACPLSTYTLCWFETLLALFERVPETMGWSESDIFSIMISPPESGGIGLSSFHRLCDMETNDPYSTAIGYVQNIIEHLNFEKSSMRNSCVDLINGVFVEQFEEVKATAFLGAPRSIHHSHLRNAKGPLSLAFKKIVLEKTDDDYFKDAIRILDSSALNRELWNCLRMFSFDVSLIEGLDSVMPYKTYSTLLGKMASSEAMLRMLDRDVRIKALRRSRKIDRENVVALHDMMHRPNPNTDGILLKLKEGRGMNVVKEFREKYYRFLKLSVSNHTAECAHVIIMSPPIGVEPLYHGRMKQLHPTHGDTYLSSWKTYEHHTQDMTQAAARTRNMYDSRHIQVVRDFPKSKGLFDSESEPFRVLDSKERGLKVSAAYAKHAESLGNPGYYYSELVLALQGVYPDSKVIKQKKNMTMAVGRSLKAASRCLGTVTHESYIFNNVYACADLERTTMCGIDDYISANKTMGNYVSFICTCRTKLICNYAAFETQAEADELSYRITFRKRGFVKRDLSVIQVAGVLSMEDECDDYITESLRKLAAVITPKATDELEDLIASSPSLSLEDTVRVRLIKAMDKRTVVATDEDGGYRSDPDSLVVEINLSLPTRRELRSDIYPHPSLYYQTIHQNLNSDLTYSKKKTQRKRAREAHSAMDSTIEKVFADELVVNQNRVSTIVRAMPNIGTVPTESPLVELFVELKSSVGMKVREYDHVASDVIASISLFFRNSCGIISELEGPNVEYSLLATSILDLARGAPPNKSLMCKSMLSRPYLRPLVLGSFISRGSTGDWADEIEGVAASLLLNTKHKSRPEYLPNTIREIKKKVIEKHDPSRHPDINNGHTDFLSEELANPRLLVEFDALLFQSILTDDLFDRAVQKIVHSHTKAKISPCTACKPIVNFLPILLTGAPDLVETEQIDVDAAEEIMYEELASIMELPSEAWLSMPTENSERSTYMSNYIGFVLSGETSYDSTKYDEYSKAGVQFIRNVATTDARYDEVRNQAERVKLAHQGRLGAMPDLVA